MRKFKQVQEVLPRADETGEVTRHHEKKDKGKAVSIQEEDSVENLKRRLESTNFEISRLKKATRKFQLRRLILTKCKLDGRTKGFKFLKWLIVVINSIAGLPLQ